MSSRNLVLRAGAKAAERLRSEGLRPETFDTLVGASGGPKWLVLRHLDEVLIDRLIVPRARPLDLVGSSIGSFRHACFAQADPRGALERFTEAYVGQSYTGRPTMEQISVESERILEHFLGESGASDIVSNGTIRSHVLAARLRRDRGLDRGPLFQAQLATAAGLNLISRRLLEFSFSRVHFGSGNPVDRAIGFDDFATVDAPLTKDNVRSALLASGSIPLVMSGVRAMPDVAPTLFDGGIIDYHYDFRFRRAKDWSSFRISSIASRRAGSTSRCAGVDRRQQISRTSSCWRPPTPSSRAFRAGVSPTGTTSSNWRRGTGSSAGTT